MNAKGRQPTQELRASQASRFAAARAARPDLYRQSSTKLVVVETDEELLDGDRVLGSTEHASMVERAL